MINILLIGKDEEVTRQLQEEKVSGEENKSIPNLLHLTEKEFTHQIREEIEADHQPTEERRVNLLVKEIAIIHQMKRERSLERKEKESVALQLIQRERDLFMSETALMAKVLP